MDACHISSAVDCLWFREEGGPGPAPGQRVILAARIGSFINPVQTASPFAKAAEIDLNTGSLAPESIFLNYRFMKKRKQGKKTKQEYQ